MNSAEGNTAAAFDLFDLPPDYFESPFKYFKQLRDEDPVHRNADGTVLLTRYEDVRKIWRDRSASVDKDEIFERKFGTGPLLRHHVTAMLFRDPPDHDRLRAVVNPYFAPSQVNRLQEFVDGLIDQLVDEALERETFDFVQDFAARIPIAVITKILGVPPEDGDHLRDLGLKVLFPLNPNVQESTIESGNQAAAEFNAYMSEYIARARRRSSGEVETVVEALVASEGPGDDQVSEEEIIQMCLLLLNGGHETTTNLIAIGTDALLDDPDSMLLWRDRAAELAQPVEEMIRFVSPLQLQGRRITAPIEVSTGEVLPADTEIILCQASANRDERAFENPEELDITRRPNAHVAFGLGVHVCIGRPLARLEAASAFPRIASRLPRLHRVGRPVWNRNVRFRGAATMPVSVA